MESAGRSRWFAIFAAALPCMAACQILLGAESNAAAMGGYDDTPPVVVEEIAVPDHFPRLCRRFASLLETRHYLHRGLDDSLSPQVWTNYLGMLDYDRSYFLESDLKELERWKGGLCTDLKEGNLEFPLKAFSIFRQRLAGRLRFVEAFLGETPDFSTDEDYLWKRKELPWPKDEAEQDELWRRRMKNELLGRIAARDLALSNKTAVLEGPSAPAATNLQAAGAAPAAPDLSPETLILRRYRQFSGIVSDADADYVLERFLGAFCQVYDPHSSYMPPTRVDDFEIDMRLSLTGIGATLQSEDGMAKIVKITPGGPAGRDTREIRLRENDKIFAVGQGDGKVEDIVHLPLDKIVKRIRGEKGTKVVLHVISASDPSGNTTKVVDLIRDVVNLEESAATGRVVRVEGRAGKGGDPGGRDFGYVRLPSFYGSMSKPGSPGYRSCTDDILRIISSFGDGIGGMVLDLRGNGGGSLKEAVSLAGAFIRTGPVVLVREGMGVQPLFDRDPATAFRKPLVVLIDKSSASASEIVAGALQDYGRALVVGDSKSHGKGTVQNIMPLIASDDKYGSLRITIAAFYRINGSSTQLKGVESDIVLPSVLEYMEVGEDKLPSAMPWTSIHPMRYDAVFGMGSFIPALREKSLLRREKDPAWAKHMERVARIKEISERTTATLNYGKRLAELKEEAAYGADSMEEDAGGEPQEGKEEPKDGIGDDLVLREALEILADLAEMAETAPEEGLLGDSAPGEVPAWFKNIFR